MDIKLGVGVDQIVPSKDLIRLVGLCEDLGYDQFWYANHKLYRDHYVGMTLAAVYSRTMEIGTFIAEPYSYHPGMIAAAIATIDEICEGRALLLLGAGVGFQNLGIQRTRPVTALRETIEICRALFQGERVTYHGDLFTLKESQLEFEPRADLPIYMATRGDKMLEMSGEYADGVMVATYATPRGLQRGLEKVEAGCRKVNRSWKDIPILARVDTCIHSDRQVARDAVRPMISLLLMASYPDRKFVHGLGLEVPEALEEVCKEKNESLSIQSGHLVTDDLVDAFSWTGTVEDVAEKVAEVVAMGIDYITYLPHPIQGEGPERIMQQFARNVMPRVHALLGLPPRR
jgi:5,10-methylenetetrahydromethanopterin reductase